MTQPVHASCVAIGGLGILLFGASGVGKSDLALRLIDRGATLVSDDYTTLAWSEAELWGSAPVRLAGKVEMRGVGIVERPYLPRAALRLAVELDQAPPRLPDPEQWEWGSYALPLVRLAALEPSAPIKVEAALALFGMPASCPNRPNPNA